MQPPEHVYRIGRKPDPWALLNWIYAHDDGTFGNRYDDPQAKYRVLYAATERFGCYVETLARFRIDPLLAAGMAAIEGDDDFYPLGEVPSEWLTSRAMGTAHITAECADIYNSAWIDRLRIKFLPLLKTFGLSDLDASVLQTSAPRAITQKVSRFIYEEKLNGIKYPSKFGHDIENWAFFEPVSVHRESTDIIKPDDSDFIRAMALHHLKLGS